MTGPTISKKHASVVRTQNVLLVFLLDQLNNLKLLIGDVGNEYLNAYTKEKLYTFAGSEFEKKSG